VSFTIEPSSEGSIRIDFEKDGSLMLDCPYAFIQFADAIEDMHIMTDDGPLDHYIRMADGLSNQPGTGKHNVIIAFDVKIGTVVMRAFESDDRITGQIMKIVVQYLSPLFEGGSGADDIDAGQHY
jgi:hypothetical protein